MPHRVLVVFVDALGPRQAAALAHELPGLQAHAGLRGVLGYSTGALPTVLTGAAPRVHGRMCLFAHGDGGRSMLSPLRWLGLLPRVVHERRRVRQLAERLLRRHARLDGYVALHRVPPREFAWLDLPEREDLFQAPAIGGAPTFLAQARAAGLDVYAAPWQLAEPARWAHAHRALRRPPALAFLYATELDGIMHRAGTASEELGPAVRRLAAHLDRARTAMAAGGAALTTIIVGDHGMADITRTYDPRRLVDALGARAFVDSTMLRVWGPASVLARARRLLAGALPGRWLDASDLAARDAPGAGRFADGLWLLPEGAMFAPSFMGGMVRGMHGYDLDEPSARAGLLTDAAPLAIHQLTDIAGTVRHALQLT